MATASGAAAPCLQQHARLSKRLQASVSDSDVRAALGSLLEYLSSRCCNPSEAAALKQWCSHAESTRGALAQEDSDSVAASQRCVAERARVCADTMAGWKDALAGDARASGASAAAERISAGSGNHRWGGVAVLVRWWHLGDDDPWEFTAAASCVQVAHGTSDGGEYEFACLRESLTAVGPYLDLMRLAAATGDWDAVSHYAAEATQSVRGHLTQGDYAGIFAALEVLRLHVALSLASSGGVAAVERVLQGSRDAQEMRRAAALLQPPGEAEHEAQETRAPLDAHGATLTPLQAYWRLTLSYAVFFNTVAAFVDAAQGRFESAAAALLGDDGELEMGPPLWGATRFPELAFYSTGSTARVAGRDAHRGPSKAAPRADTVVGALFPCSATHTRASVSDYYLAEFVPLVTRVVAPAASFSTLVVLAAISTRPLATVLKQLRGWAELQELCESSDALLRLLDALRHGQLGAAWHHAQEATARHLVDEPHLRSSVVAALLEGVKRSLCYHYLRVRRTVRLDDAAADLGFTAAADVAATAEALISTNCLAARIDLVEGAVCIDEAREDGETAAAATRIEAAARAVLGLSALTVQLSVLAAQRNLMPRLDDG
ncbi:hypothetical protein NESM_000601800 [Novymonas esmeraldas]|uniref:Uncharacterized protein n=1 Tax=Novymonas esmeraldas TaxID=1808958 RepID=A0AAW0ER27_9TRYP